MFFFPFICLSFGSCCWNWRRSDRLRYANCQFEIRCQFPSIDKGEFSCSCCKIRKRNLKHFWETVGNLEWDVSLNAVECNLTESTTKERLCSLEGLRNGYAHSPVHSPMSAFPRAQRCFLRHLCQCIRQKSAFPCLLLCSFVHLR